MQSTAVPPAALTPLEPDRRGSGHGPSPDVTRRASHRWLAVVAISAAIAVVAGMLIWAKDSKQDGEITTNEGAIGALSDVVRRQDLILGQVCQIAGGRVDRAPQAADACHRVAAGKPAIPTPPPPAPVAPAAVPLGIEFVAQDGTCYVDVGLTNHTVSKFGPFCGQPGQSGKPGPTGSPGPTGPTGPPGASGQPGASGINGQDGADGKDGPPGVGIADMTTTSDGCSVIVTLTDGSSRTLGPFCGSPASAITLTLSDGRVQACQRTNSDPMNPAYSCTEPPPPPPTTEPPPT